MQVFIKLPSSKTLAININPKMKITTLKQIICQRSGIHESLQVLHYGGKILLNNNSIKLYHIQHESTLHLCLRLLGGGKGPPSCNLTYSYKVRNLLTQDQVENLVTRNGKKVWNKNAIINVSHLIMYRNNDKTNSLNINGQDAIITQRAIHEIVSFAIEKLKIDFNKTPSEDLCKKINKKEIYKYKLIESPNDYIIKLKDISEYANHGTNDDKKDHDNYNEGTHRDTYNDNNMNQNTHEEQKKSKEDTCGTQARFLRQLLTPSIRNTKVSNESIQILIRIKYFLFGNYDSIVNYNNTVKNTTVSTYTTNGESSVSTRANFVFEPNASNTPLNQYLAENILPHATNKFNIVLFTYGLQDQENHTQYMVLIRKKMEYYLNLLDGL